MSHLFGSILNLIQSGGAAGLSLNAEAGSFSISGVIATSARSYSFNAQEGGISISGADTTALSEKRLNAEGSGVAILLEKFLAHYNNSLVDEYGLVPSASTNIAYTTGKFANGITGADYLAPSITYPLDFNPGTEDFTAEFQLKFSTGNNSLIAYLIDSTNTSIGSSITATDYVADGLVVAITDWNSLATYSFLIGANDGLIHSYALVRKGTYLYLFREGNPLDHYNTSTHTVINTGYANIPSNRSFRFTNLRTLIHSSRPIGTIVLDEVRLTAAALYTSAYSPQATEFAKKTAGYPLTVFDFTVYRDYTSVASSASYIITGADVTFTQATNPVASPTSYALTGAGASTLAAYILNAGGAAGFVLTGSPATFSVAKGVNCEAYNLILTGAEAATVANRFLDAKPPASIDDPYFANTIFYQSFDTDMSDYFGHTVSSISNIARNTGEALFGAAGLFPTNTNMDWYYSMGLGSEADFTGLDFTIEFAMRVRSKTDNQFVLGVPGNYNRLQIINNGGHQLTVNSTNNSNPQYLGVIPAGWDNGSYHRHAICFEYATGYFYMYLDGTRYNIANVGQAYNFANAYMGCYSFTGYSADAAFDEIRITKGVARYTGASYSLTTDPFYGATSGYTDTGFAATMIVGRSITAGYSSYSLTGSDATLTYTPAQGIASPGSFLVTGADSQAKRTYTVIAETSSYVITGQAAGYSLNKQFTASPRTFTITGYSSYVNLERVTGAGSYSQGKNPASFYNNRVLDSNPTSYALTGFDANLSNQQVASPKAFNLYGSDAFFRIESPANPSSYTLTGYAAILYSVEAPGMGVYNLTGYPITSYQSIVGSADPGHYYLYSLTLPPPGDVRDGVEYGYDGELVGEWDAVDKTIKYDIETDKLVKILSNKLVMSL